MARELKTEILKLEKKIDSVFLPPDLKEKILGMLGRLKRMTRGGEYSLEYEQVARYIDWVIHLPWNKKSKDILDLSFAKKILDKNHYGLREVKERILEYLAVLRLKKEAGVSFSRAPILLFVGLVGTGKTTLAFSIAEAMGRRFARIPFGGMGDAFQLRGQSRAYPEAEPGQIIKSLRRGGTKNPVILLDEIDRVADKARSEIMGVLIELLDPEQNKAFVDHYLDYPFDLSEVLFIATCNNTTNISPPVLDRLEVIRMPSYSDQEKIIIGKDYLLPKAIEECGLSRESLEIEEDVWPQIVRPLGFDAGTRTLERTIYAICRKVAKMVVEGKGQKFRLTSANIKEFLPT